MQAAKVRLDMACKYLGHEIPSVHVQNYNDYNPVGYANLVLPFLVYPLNLDVLKRPADCFEKIIKREKGKNRARERAIKTKPSSNA